MRKTSIAIALILVGCGSDPPPKAQEPTAASAPAPVDTTAPATPAVENTTGSSASSAPASAAPAADDVRPIPLEPLKMTIAKKDDKALELKTDGTVAMKDGTVVAKVVKNEVQTPDGEWVVRLQKDGTFQSRTKKVDRKDGKVVGESWSDSSTGKLNDKGELTFDKGGKAWVDESGAIKLQGRAGPSDVRIDGGPQSRRTGILLYLASMNGGMTASAPPKK